MRSPIVRTRYTCVALVVCALIVASFPATASAKGVSAAPSLGAPTGIIVKVDTGPALEAALRSLVSGTTVVLAPGVYRLTAPLTVGNVADVVIRGESDMAADVIIEGPGFLADESSTAAHAFVIRGQRVTLANLTIRAFPAAAVAYEAGAVSPRIYNVASIDNRGSVRSGAVSGGTIEYSRFEYSFPVAAGSGAPAVDVRGGSKWTVRHSLFKGLKGVDGAASPAVLLYGSLTSAVVDANTFVNCGQEIVFGASSRRDTSDQTSGVIRNNFIARDVSSSAAAAVTLAGSPGSRVLHNTVLMNGSYTNAIELKFPATRGVRVQNNLLDAPVVLQNGATGSIDRNDTTASPAYFVDPAGGDLHLLAAATSAIDAATAIDGAEKDWDGQSRATRRSVDYGADEFVPSTSATALTSSTTSTDGPSTAASTEPTADAQSTTLAVAEAASTLPSPWATRDIGGPRIAGAATYASGTFTVTGAGEGIAGTSDEFRFVYQPLTGDGQIVARIATLQNTNQWSKAGVMIRQSLTANSAYAMALLSAKNGLNFQRRLTAGAGTKNTSGGSGSVPQWVRVVRSGSSFSAYRSTNGSSWTLIGTDTVSMSGTVYVGLAVTSQRPGGKTAASFTNVALTTSSSGAGTALPSPWASRDVGNSQPAGSATYSSGTFTVKAGGADIWGTSDKFQFVYRPLAGDGEVVARVNTLQYTHSWAKAGIMMRTSLDANAAFAYALVSAGSGLSFHRRTSAGVSATAVNSSSGAAPVWLRLSRKGSQFTASRSSDGTNWSVIGTTNISMPGTIYVGLAVTSHNVSTATTASFTSVAVNTGSTSNQLPTVSVTSPSSGQAYTAPATVNVTASASDGDGTISKVDFYLGSKLIGSDSTSPYAASASSVAAGTYSITAVAHDNAGGQRTSSAVSITVSSSSGTTVPQTLTFTPSVDHATLVTKYVFEVFTAGATPSTATPVRTLDLGKPSVVNGGITVDVGATIEALSGGSYFATVRAVNSYGSSRSAPSNTFSR